MLRLAIEFLIVALIAGLLGFGNLANMSVGIAQIIFFVFLVLFLIAAVVHAMTGRYPPA